MSTKVESYLKVGNRFVQIKEYTGALPDERYVEGAIECRIDDRQVFALKQWDLVDQLWAYIVEGLSKVKQGEEYDVCFPDQPLRLRFKPLSAYCVEVAIGDVCQQFDLPHFVNALAGGAIDFFEAIKALSPSASETWDRYLREARSLMTE
jgi:hypothetical protein